VGDLLQVLAKKNIPVFAASGDDGARDGGEGNNVDYPASSPNAFGCGGTSIAADGKLETAWSYGGGGLSGIFKTPTWQVMVCIPPCPCRTHHEALWMCLCISL
jgi:kumamolisin